MASVLMAFGLVFMGTRAYTTSIDAWPSLQRLMNLYGIAFRKPLALTISLPKTMFSTQFLCLPMAVYKLSPKAPHPSSKFISLRRDGNSLFCPVPILSLCSTSPPQSGKSSLSNNLPPCSTSIQDQNIIIAHLTPTSILTPAKIDINK